MTAPLDSAAARNGAEAVDEDGGTPDPGRRARWARGTAAEIRARWRRLRWARRARPIDGAPTGGRIIRPGWNCWRVAETARAAVLVDGDQYFRHLETTLLRAQRSILIVGWDFDARIRLRPEADAKPLGQILRELVEVRPELEVRVLVWSLAVLHAPGAPWPLVLGAPWQAHPRIRVRLDRRHPLYGAHHQKIVAVDDAVAFAGGMDLTVQRWDTPEHLPDDPRRVDPDGTPYGAVHDVHMAVDGEAARALSQIARNRWRVATGETVPSVAVDGDPWPEALAPDFAGVDVAIARTAPPWGGEPRRREGIAMAESALLAARRSIYIEAQYLTARRIGAVLARRLGEPDGPEVVVVSTHSSRGLLEEFAMGTNRDRLIRKLRRHDRHGRLRALYPVVCGADEGGRLLVHSKVVVIDDVFVRIGSSNFNNRSVGVDTECDLGIEAGDAAVRGAIAALRDRLLGEHLQVAPAVVGRTVDAAGGSLIAAIDRLNTGDRGLRAFAAMTSDGPTRPVCGTFLLDPETLIDPLWFLHRRRFAPRHAPARPTAAAT
ncbi:MAG: phospholipase [Alphaproteobacteria bacterium]|nr:phospholipase [Alphaproteobacteria bacterium]